MKTFGKYLIPFLLTLAAFALTGFYPTDCAGPDAEACESTILPADTDCSWNGYPLYGKVQFVESFPDIKVQVVDAFPDLKVKLVDAFPDQCGEWQVVSSFPDVKVQIVESFPDLKIQFVESFPGMVE